MYKLEDNNYLVDPFGNSIGYGILEYTGEAVKLTLDTYSGEDSTIKDVPFVGTSINYTILESEYMTRTLFTS